MKKRRHFLTAVCLLVGLVVLSSSVYANYDNANGYKNYKEAVKNLALYTDDVSISADIRLYIDGELEEGNTMVMKVSDKGSSEYNSSFSGPGDDLYEYYYYDDGDYQYRYYPDRNEYRKWENNSYRSPGNLIGVDMDDKTSAKMARFFELSADLLIGDLKNNVVLVSEDDGVKNYAVEISKDQMPEIVNAGLSLIFGISAYDYENYDPSYVSYADWNGLFTTWCEENYDEETAEKLISIYCGYYKDAATIEYAEDVAYTDEDYKMVDEVVMEFETYYEKILNDNGGGMLYVMADGSYEHYDSYAEYEEAMGYSVTSSRYGMAMFGEDPYIESAKMTASISEDGELLANYLEATMAGHDQDGEKHTATVKIDFEASDYGTTVPDVFDPEGKTEQR